MDNNPKKHFESKVMEDWLDAFFLDPFTTYLDEAVFRIDLYESERAFIVEALLPNVEKNNIDLTLDSNKLQIKVMDSADTTKSNLKVRTVSFPFPIDHLKMEATFQQDILEIKIYKDDE